MPYCPTCGALPGYIVEKEIVHYGISPLAGSADVNGGPDIGHGPEYDYDGQYETFYETSEPVEDEEGKVTLVCEDGGVDHEWKTRVLTGDVSFEHPVIGRPDDTRGKRGGDEDA